VAIPHHVPMPTFDERAPEWDTPERMDRAREIAQAVRDAIPLTRATRLLELGAGTGLLGIALADSVGSVVLADASAGMLAVADAKIRDAGLGNVTTRRLELTVDPLPGDRYDLVVSLMALHHVADTAAGFAAMRELLAPGGRLAIVDLDAEDGSFHTDPDAPVHHGLDRDHLAALARAAGFGDLAFRTVLTIEKHGRPYPLFLLTAALA
jgi:ubiquinone/menaquinone biosynthesis C-methylase UbiE